LTDGTVLAWARVNGPEVSSVEMDGGQRGGVRALVIARPRGSISTGFEAVLWEREGWSHGGVCACDSAARGWRSRGRGFVFEIVRWRASRQGRNGVVTRACDDTG
jgi:hypothetical protein